MMLQILPMRRSTGRPVFVLGVIALLVAACGLGMDTQARLDRGQQAFSDEEYRAAVIDAKNILLEEPENVAARLLLGRASVEIGDGVSAEKELRRAVELGAGINNVIVDLGRALLLQRKFDALIAEMTLDTASSETDRVKLMLMRGDALIGLQQPISARDVYSDVFAIDNDNLAAQLGIVNSYIGERNFLQARETLNQVLLLDDGFVPGWLTSGSLSMRARNAERAARDYERAAQLSVAQADLYNEMHALSGFADAVLTQSKFDDARPVLERMRQIAPADIRTLLLAARLAVSDEDWPGAQEILMGVLKRAPDYRQAQVLLGFVHKESGNLGQAEMYLSAVVAAVPDDANARRLLAETRLEMNKAEEAMQVLEPLLKGPGADARSLSMAAGASIDLGEFDAATDLLRRGVAENPDNIDLQIQLAFAQFRAGNAGDAQAVLEAIPAAEVGSNEFRRDSLLVLTQMAQERSAEALENARGLLERWPDRAEAHNLVGLVEISTGDYTSARKSFTASGELMPDDVTSIRYLAQLDEAENDLRSAHDRYLLILELQPKDARSMVALAKLAVQAENQEETREWLEKAREADPAAIVPRAILGSYYLANKEFAAAEKVAEEALKLNPELSKLHSILGYAKFGRQDFRGAESSFDRALVLGANEPADRLMLARAQVGAGNKTTAQATLELSFDQILQHTPSATLLAALKADAGDLEGATRIARRLQELHPDDADPHALDAELHVRRGDLIAAAKSYDKALEFKTTPRFAVRSYQIRDQAGLANQMEPLINYLRERPLDTNMRVYVAQAYQNLDDLGQANTQYERTLSDDPGNFVAANNLAWNYFKSGDPRAEELARQAYGIQPDNSAVADTLGWILVKKGALQDGIAILRNASELGDDRPDIRFHLAAGLVADGQETEAKSILREILAIESDFSTRQEAESLLSTL